MIAPTSMLNPAKIAGLRSCAMRVPTTTLAMTITEDPKIPRPVLCFMMMTLQKKQKICV